MINLFIGENERAQSIDSIFIGDENNKAQIISDIYIGDNNNIANLIEKPILLPQFQQVKYIEGTGSQYINTNTYITVNQIIVEVKIAFISDLTTAGDTYYMGMYNTDKRFNIVTKETTGYLQMGIGKGYWRDSAQPNLNTIYTLKVDMKNLELYLNEIKKTKTSSSAFSRFTDTKMWIGLLAGSDGTGAVRTNKGHARIYSTKIWQSGELIHDYYPCIRNYDSKPGLYDIVGNEFLINAGTGEFLYGPKYEGIL